MPVTVTGDNRRGRGRADWFGGSADLTRRVSSGTTGSPSTSMRGSRRCSTSTSFGATGHHAAMKSRELSVAHGALLLELRDEGLELGDRGLKLGHLGRWPIDRRRLVVCPLGRERHPAFHRARPLGRDAHGR